VNILVACECSGVVRDALIEQGHHALSCDILDTERDGPHYKGDVLDILDWGWDGMVAHPDCTRLTNSGVRWLHVPPKGVSLVELWCDLDDAAAFYSVLRDADIPRKAIENPVMHKYARERINPGARQVVQPWWFGDKAFKATGLELIGLPPLVPTNKLIPPLKGTQEHKDWSFIHRASPGPDRKRLRSRTFQGVADAMASQWFTI
tara:strand:- start:49 stop:663 length:615 start_codon:yes stop_codon:yes gene_type:complete